MPGMQALNIDIFHWLAAGQSPHPQLLWFAAAMADGASWLCVAVMGWVAWRRPSQRAYVMATLFAAGAAAVLAHALAEATNLPRPFAMGLSPAHIEHGARGSLPSAHASVMFAVALIFFMRAALRDAAWAILAITVVTGWARVHVGVHFPLDIGAGLLLGTIVAAGFQALLLFSRKFIVPVILHDEARSAQQKQETAESTPALGDRKPRPVPRHPSIDSNHSRGGPVRHA